MQLLDVRYHSEVYPERWRWLRLIRYIRAIRRAMKVVHLRLPEASA